MAATKEEFEALTKPIISKYGKEVYGVCMMMDFYVRSGITVERRCNDKYVNVLGHVIHAWAQQSGIEHQLVIECMTDLRQAIETWTIINSIPD